MLFETSKDYSTLLIKRTDLPIRGARSRQKRGSRRGQYPSLSKRWTLLPGCTIAWLPSAAECPRPRVEFLQNCHVRQKKKNRCRLREINVFLDVNRIGPKNPYREEIFALLRSSNPRITFPTTRTYVLPLVTKVMISSSSISNLSRRDSYADRWSLVMTFFVVTLVQKKKENVANTSFKAFVLLSSSRFGDWTDLAGTQ